MFSGAEPFVHFGREYYEEQFSYFFKFRPVVKEEMLFKDISYLELWQPFCSAEQNNLCNFGRGCYEEQHKFYSVKLFLMLVNGSGEDFLSGVLAAPLTHTYTGNA